MRSLTFLSCSKKKSYINEPQRPNILFDIADDASMNSFGAHGCDWIKTPAVDQLAKQGAVFPNAYKCNPQCAAAHACLVTGMYSWQLKETCNHWPHFPAEFKFYQHLLMTVSYHVGLTGRFFEISFGMRPEKEMYRIQDEPDCLHNLASVSEYAEIKNNSGSKWNWNYKNRVIPGC